MTYTSKSVPPKPPLKGSFPLDHDGDCKSLMQQYMDCLKVTVGCLSMVRQGTAHAGLPQQNQHVATRCRDASRQYLECRMAHGLMAPEEMHRLGFDKGGSADKTT